VTWFNRGPERCIENTAEANEDNDAKSNEEADADMYRDDADRVDADRAEGSGHYLAMDGITTAVADVVLLPSIHIIPATPQDSQKKAQATFAPAPSPSSVLHCQPSLMW
jgi:hypothetical protein